MYTGKDLPPVVIGVGGGGGQEENATPGPHFRPSKPSAVIQQVSYDHACKLKNRLRELISCLCCVQTSHMALKADSRGNSETKTGSELSQPKFELPGIVMMFS